MNTLTTHDKCRLDGSPLFSVLNLGDLHFSDFLELPNQDTPQYPLELCVGTKSGLLQLRHTVNPEQMYRNYHYVSGLNETMKKHLQLIAQSPWLSVETDDVVIDVGCNDGTLLQGYNQAITKVGYDPSNIKSEGVDEFYNDFFDERALEKFPPRSVKVITTIAMFYDIENPKRFAQVVDNLLTDDGTWVVEMHYSRDMVNRVGFDAICHEHLTYYDLHTMTQVLEGTHLRIVHVEFNDVNGGSFRCYIRKSGSASASVWKAWRYEIEHPLDLKAFRDNVYRNRDEVQSFFLNCLKSGNMVYGYGASTKGSTMAQFYGLTPELMPKIADRNPKKWGLYTSGTHIPIISEEHARGDDPEYFFVFPYHFIDGFVKREYGWLTRPVINRRSDVSRAFVIPVPYLTLRGL